jgi:hypothetical protein
MKMIALLLMVTPVVHADDISCPARWAPAGWIAEGAAVGNPVRDIGVIIGEMEPVPFCAGRSAKRGVDSRCDFPG